MEPAQPVSSGSIVAKLGLKMLLAAVLASIAFFGSLLMTTPHESQTGATINSGPEAASPSVLEMDAISRAKQAMSEGAPDKALAILDGMARDFPSGSFVEERRALHVLALVGSGKREEAKLEAAAFAHDYPNGTMADRVRNATAEL